MAGVGTPTELSDGAERSLAVSDIEAPQQQQPTGALSKLWKNYFGSASSQEEVSLAWQAVSQLAQTGESLFRIENASWRIWSRKATAAPPSLATAVHPEAEPDAERTAELMADPNAASKAELNPEAKPESKAESKAEAKAESAVASTPLTTSPAAPPIPTRRPTMFETYIPQKFAELPTAVLERLKSDSVTGTISSLLGENLAELISTAIHRAEASGILDPASPAYDRWRRQSSPSAFIRKWGWLAGKGIDRSDSAVDLDTELSIDELLQRIDTERADDETDLFSLKSTPPVPPNTPAAATPGLDMLKQHSAPSSTFRKRSIHPIPIRKPSLLSQMIDQSLQEQDMFQVAARRRRMQHFMRRRAIELEGQEKRGMNVETYLKLMDACDDAASVRTAASKPVRDTIGDPELRRKVTDTAQSLIDPTWRIRDARTRRMPWFEQRRAVTFEESETDRFFVW
ncbi:hypothetical protein DFJ77DRAFT_151961 [Powellomyces hirtus]|nr:hypothetical protein DFJ77DRAFT_151961 [Powellomyces hirtus]